MLDEQRVEFRCGTTRALNRRPSRWWMARGPIALLRERRYGSLGGMELNAVIGGPRGQGTC